MAYRLGASAAALHSQLVQAHAAARMLAGQSVALIRAGVERGDQVREPELASDTVPAGGTVTVAARHWRVVSCLDTRQHGAALSAEPGTPDAVPDADRYDAQPIALCKHL
jgi:hypothetical protein